MPTDNKHLLFVYGTLRRGNGNDRLLVEHGAMWCGTAWTVEKHLMAGLHVQPLPADAPAELIAQHAGQVIGDLWRCNDAGLAACDRLERHPIGWCRTPVKIHWPGAGEGTPADLDAEIYYWKPYDISQGGGRSLNLPSKSGKLEYKVGWR